jgi:archaellum component FlaC
LVGILPIMMDFMEDVKDDFPKLYKKQIKKSGNDFVDEVYKLGNQIYEKMESENDKEVGEFYNEVINMGTIFHNWIAEL